MKAQTNFDFVTLGGRCVVLFSRGCGLLSICSWILPASLLFWASSAHAQVAVVPYAGGNWGAAQTPEGAALHGAADVIRAEGEFNRSSAQAMVQYENARNVYLTNRRKAAETYFATKEMYQVMQADKRDRNRHTHEAVNKAARSTVPQLLDSDALNPQTGKIAWPKALLDSRYSAKRIEIEKLFELRATTSGGPDNLKKIETITADLNRLLKTNVAKMPANDYMQARKFLDSLTLTASQS